MKAIEARLTAAATAQRSGVVMRTTVGTVQIVALVLTLLAAALVHKFEHTDLLLSGPAAIVAAVPQVVGFTSRWVLARRDKVLLARGREIVAERAAKVKELREGLSVPFARLAPLLEKYDPGSLKSPANEATHRMASRAKQLARDRADLIVIVNQLLDVKFCSECTRNVVRALGPLKSRLARFRNEIGAAAALTGGASSLEDRLMEFATGKTVGAAGVAGSGHDGDGRDKGSGVASTGEKGARSAASADGATGGDNATPPPGAPAGAASADLRRRRAHYAAAGDRDTDSEGDDEGETGGDEHDKDA